MQKIAQNEYEIKRYRLSWAKQRLIIMKKVGCIMTNRAICQARITPNRIKTRFGIICYPLMVISLIKSKLRKCISPTVNGKKEAVSACFAHTIE
jgi:hypothetical protein